jgi:hypothetical protein
MEQFDFSYVECSFALVCVLGVRFVNNTGPAKSFVPWPSNQGKDQDRPASSGGERPSPVSSSWHLDYAPL